MRNLLVATTFLACLFCSQEILAQGRIKEGDRITFLQSHPACKTKKGLEKFVRLTLSDDRSSVENMFSQDGSTECSMLPPGTTFKVLEAEYNNPEIGLIKFTNLTRTDGAGIWTLSSNLKVVK